MKKCTFYRTVYKDNKIQAIKTDGYSETLTDKTGNEITLCFHKESKNVWVVTEKSTGFRVSQGSKRMEALEEAKKYLNMIYDKVQKLEKYKSIIASAYAEV